MKLYEIDEALEKAIDAALDPETGEIVDDNAFADMEALTLARESKLEGVGLWGKNMEAEADAVKREKDVFAKREKALRNKIEAVKTHYLAPALKGEKFKTDKIVMSFRTSDAVVLIDGINPYDLFEIDPNFVTLPEPTFNKTAIKAALKAGKEIDGAFLVKRQNLQIK